MKVWLQFRGARAPRTLATAPSPSPTFSAAIAELKAYFCAAQKPTCEAHALPG